MAAAAPPVAERSRNASGASLSMQVQQTRPAFRNRFCLV